MPEKKTIELNDVVKWKSNHRIYECIGLINYPAAELVSLEENKCPNCGHSTGKDVIVSIIDSRQFQENVEMATTRDLKLLVDTLTSELNKRDNHPA